MKGGEVKSRQSSVCVESRAVRRQAGRQAGGRRFQPINAFIFPVDTCTDVTISWPWDGAPTTLGPSLAQRRFPSSPLRQ